MSNVLNLKNICKTYQLGAEALDVLKDASYSIDEGQSVALIGPSGAGKSTLLQIAGLLDEATSGEVVIDGIVMSNQSDKQMTAIRGAKIGFVYQFHHLIPECSALENVMMPAQIAGNANADIARQMLNEVGLGDRMTHRPAELSGGEKQRVAIARALINKPKLLLADEPTGNLDHSTADTVMELLLSLCKSHGLALLMATHNQELASRCQKIITITNGAIVSV
ncbi:MAG: ABC transporter ATP-binding protein [Rickettsiales bacterium]|nr:ABC transporter ATP-binding protein [Rickettsiales bacterium]